MRFDTKTLDAITPNSEPEKIEKLVGNVTRFNIVSGFGRFYLRSERRIVPFLISDVRDQILLRAASESLSDSLSGKGNRLFLARKVKSASGHLLRYVVQEIKGGV
ncbi:hypothetical protein D3C72_2303190 [compost metagenome]